jgi:hypothetical protein
MTPNKDCENWTQITPLPELSMEVVAMGPSRAPASPGTAASAGIVAGMLAMIVIPAIFALRSVATPGTLAVGPNPSPHGYTWSLLLFVVPIAAILGCFLPSEHLTIASRRAFVWTSVILGCLGCALDFVFAHSFFLFPNPQATLEILVPALGHRVPVEEYIFYFTGFITILLVYIWLSEYWLAAYTVADYAAEAQALNGLVKFHLTSLLLGLVLIAAAVIYKKDFSSVPEGWPGYFIVLVAGGLIPSASSFPATSRFINWRALSLTMFFILLISLLWEATLALPYGWWNYQHPAMTGIFIGAWSGLPIEAVMVWLAVTYATVIVFEAVKIWLASGRSAREMFLGRR